MGEKKAQLKSRLVLSTANGSKMGLPSWLSIIKFDGIYCTVGLPEEPLQIAAFSLLGAQLSAAQLLSVGALGGAFILPKIHQRMEFFIVRSTCSHGRRACWSSGVVSGVGRGGVFLSPAPEERTSARVHTACLSLDPVSPVRPLLFVCCARALSLARVRLSGQV
jgi:hypothetical protein